MASDRNCVASDKSKSESDVPGKTTVFLFWTELTSDGWCLERKTQIVATTSTYTEVIPV